RLLALRTMVNLDLAAANANSKKPALDAKFELFTREINEDAQRAIMAGAVAEGNFALGRLAELLGEWSKAKDSYRQAVKASPPEDPIASRAKLALARVLLREFEAKPRPRSKPVEETTEPEEKPAEKKPPKETTPEEKKPVEKPAEK